MTEPDDRLDRHPLTFSRGASTVTDLIFVSPLCAHSGRTTYRGSSILQFAPHIRA
jgi:hypothetical protein